MRDATSPTCGKKTRSFSCVYVSGLKQLGRADREGLKGVYDDDMDKFPKRKHPNSNVHNLMEKNWSSHPFINKLSF